MLTNSNLSRLGKSRLSLSTLGAVMLLAFLSSSAYSFADDAFENTPANPNFREVPRDEVAKAMENLKPAPRLLLTDEAIDSVRTKVENDPRWKGYYDSLKTRLDKHFNDKPVEYVVTGLRLLSVSREALRRTLGWSFLYRYTGDEKYAKRVEQEAVAIAEFKDWHPSHFLDVAEMAVAEAIAYDSCKETFSAENRAKVYEALKTKGVVESMKVRGWWKRNTANWNQVCWCGNLYAALAIASDGDEADRELAIDAVWNSVNGVTWASSSYEPDGNYTEGPGYWGYGTGFNLLLLGALESALGEDFGRSDLPGFLKSIQYYEHVFGTTGEAFNYPDSGGGKMFEATAFWYGKKLNAPEILYNENKALRDALLRERGELEGVAPFGSLSSDRVGVCALLWGSAVDENAPLTAPEELGYVGIGNKRCCVALFRTSWSSDGAYLGIKCGAPNAPHGHLDEGGFVYDDLGARWIVELGPEDYNRIEQRGMNLWNMSQNSDRWKLLRYNNFGHSVPTINGKLQIADGLTSFIETKIGASGEASSALIDLTPVYKNDVAKATRKATLQPDGALIVEDYFEALDKDAEIERRFLTKAKVDVDKENVVFSTPDGKLTKKVETKSELAIDRDVIPAQTENDYDSKNPGVSIFIEKSTLKAGEKATFTTTFYPAQKNEL